MDRRLVFAYLLAISAIAFAIVAARVAAPVTGRGTWTVFFAALTLAMFVSAYLFFTGARRSTGVVRKVLAYLMCAFACAAGVSQVLAVATVAGGVVASG